MSTTSSKKSNKKDQPEHAKHASAAGPAIPRVPWNPLLGLIFVALVYVLSQILGSLLVSMYPVLHHWSHARSVDWLNNSTTGQFVYYLIAESVIVGGIYFFLKAYRCSFKIIGLKRPRWQDLAYGVAAVPLYYILYLLTVGVVSHVTNLNVNQQQDIGFNNVQGAFPLILTFISLVALPPLAEEIMVRGFLYSSLKKALPTTVAVIVTSLLFASAHLPEGGSAGPLYIAALDTFILSLVLIYLREKTGSLWSSITLHAIKNGIAFVSLFVIHLK